MLGAATVAALVAGALVRVEGPADVGAWAPVALDGSALTSVAATSAGLVVAGPRGVSLVRADGTVRDLAVAGPAHDLLATEGAVLAATDAGVRSIERDTGEVHDLGPPGRVDRLAAGPTGLLAITEGALLRRDDVGAWQTVVDDGVRTVAVVDDEVLVGSATGLARLDARGELERVLGGPPVDLVAAVDLGDERRVFAASRKRPRLRAAPAPGGPWTPSEEGLRLATVETVAADQNEEGRVLAAGTGLADGEQIGGVVESDDGGRTWRDREDRLSNVHVLDLTVRAEPLRARVSLAGTDFGNLPVTAPRPRFYAATNGAGLYARQAPLALADVAAAAAPVGRLVGPAALGVLALVAAWRGFAALRPMGPAARRSPPHDLQQGRSPSGCLTANGRKVQFR